MRWLRPFIAAAIALPAAIGAAEKAGESQKLPVTRVQDLHYGDVLFHLYKGDDFEAITRLNAYEHWKLMPNHGAESQLLLGGLYLSLGLHNEAGQRFERLLTQDIPAGVRNRAWFYLAKVWYARGYLDKAEQALLQIQGTLAGSLESERQHLFANVLLRQGRFAEAESLLENWNGPVDWTAYAKFNLGVALVRQGRVDDADPFLTFVGTLETTQPELLALKDRANLALGYAYLQAKMPDKARPVLQRVRLNGPYSNKALLGAGWAEAELGNFRGALTPWLELRDRSLLDAAVQESYLAVPYAFGKLDANAQAAEHYEAALLSFSAENARLDDAINRIRDGNMLEELLANEKSTQYGWFWQLNNLPDAPESRYLYTALAGHDFQEGLKNYRDIAYMGKTLERWADSMEAFGNMIDTRELAHAQRLPKVDALLWTNAPEELQRRREELQNRLDTVERQQDVAALGSPEEKDQWARVQALEAALAELPDDEETNAMRDRLRLVKGVLYFRLNESFKARMWQQRRTIKDLDSALREAQNRWIRVDRARKSVPTNTGEFAQRLIALQKRIDALNVRLAAVAEKQNEHLERLAILELEKQKDRLAAYEVQARFALASIYDRAAEALTPRAGEQPIAPEQRIEPESQSAAPSAPATEPAP